MKPSFEYVSSLYRYDPDTGLIYHKTGKGRCRVGFVAGTRRGDGRWSIGLLGKKYYCHVIAWLLHYGEWPDMDMDIDHINGDNGDNRIDNLRVGSHSLNMQNRTRPVAHSRSKLIGASYNKVSGKWFAQIKKDGKNMHIGYYETAEEASAAYIAVKRAIHEWCTI